MTNFYLKFEFIPKTKLYWNLKKKTYIRSRIRDFNAIFLIELNQLFLK
jgi:hypothetical protein